jgi:para-nitrobenzyl esterase
MVWIHGGGYTTGSGSSSVYDGESLARRGVVLVSVNYRLGPFGWLAHPLLSKESEKGVSGNYGLLDQIAALRWVNANAAAFGGDPDRVTIFGESAGAGSVCRLMVCPLAKGLFHRAIAQSGGAHGRNRHLRETWYGLEPAQKLGETLAEALDCDSAPDPLAALRAKTAEEVLEASDPAQGLFGKGTKFGPVVDGWALPDDPAAMMAAGQAAEVPFLAGFNADEGTVFLQQLPVRRPAGYRLAIQTLFEEDAEEILKLYPASSGDEVAASLNRLVTVSAFGGPARWMARVLARPEAPTRLYFFERVPPRSPLRGFGAFHGAEIAYVFGTGSATAALGWEERDRALSETMQAFWVRFAASGDPNGEGLPPWPAYSGEKDEAMAFGDGVELRSGLFKEGMELFEKIQARSLERRKDPSAFKRPGR